MIKKLLIIILSILFLDSYCMQDLTASFITVDGKKLEIKKTTVNYIPVLKNLVDTRGTDWPIELFDYFFLTAANIRDIVNFMEDQNIPKGVFSLNTQMEELSQIDSKYVEKGQQTIAVLTNELKILESHKVSLESKRERLVSKDVGERTKINLEIKDLELLSMKSARELYTQESALNQKQEILKTIKENDNENKLPIIKEIITLRSRVEELKIMVRSNAEKEKTLKLKLRSLPNPKITENELLEWDAKINDVQDKITLKTKKIDEQKEDLLRGKKNNKEFEKDIMSVHYQALDKIDPVITNYAKKQDIVSYIQTVACANYLQIPTSFVKALIQHTFDTQPVLIKDEKTKQIIEECAHNITKNKKYLKPYMQDVFNKKGYSSLRLSYSTPLTTNKAPVAQWGGEIVIAEQDGFIFIERIKDSWQKTIKKYPGFPIHPLYPKGMRFMWAQEITILDSRNNLIEYDLNDKNSNVLKVKDCKKLSSPISDDQWAYDDFMTIVVANQNGKDIARFNYLSRNTNAYDLKERQPFAFHSIVDKLQFIKLNVNETYHPLLLILSGPKLFCYNMRGWSTKASKINYWTEEEGYQDLHDVKGFDSCNKHPLYYARLLLFTEKEVSLASVRFAHWATVDKPDIVVQKEVAFTFDSPVEKASFFEENNVLVKTANQYIVFRKKEENSSYDKASSWERTQLPLQLFNAVASGDGGIAGIKDKKFAIYEPTELSLSDMIQYDYYAKQNDIRLLEKLINNEKIVTWSDRWNSIQSAIIPSRVSENKITLPKKKLPTKIGNVTLSKDASLAKLYFRNILKERNKKRRESYNRKTLDPSFAGLYFRDVLNERNKKERNEKQRELYNRKTFVPIETE